MSITEKEVHWTKTIDGHAHAESCECYTDHQKFPEYRVCQKSRCKNGRCSPVGDDLGFEPVGAGYSRRIHRCGICHHRFLSRRSV